MPRRYSAQQQIASGGRRTDSIVIKITLEELNMIEAIYKLKNINLLGKSRKLEGSKRLFEKTENVDASEPLNNSVQA